MPMRVFIVTGTSCGAAARTASVEDGAQQVALPRQRRSPTLAGDLGDRAAEVEVDVVRRRTRRTRMRTASPTYRGSTPYSCTERVGLQLVERAASRASCA